MLSRLRKNPEALEPPLKSATKILIDLHSGFRLILTFQLYISKIIQDSTNDMVDFGPNRRFTEAAI